MRAAVVLLILSIGCKRDPGYVVHRTSGPMAIDGVLAESGWGRAEKAGPFVRSLDGKPATAAVLADHIRGDAVLGARASEQKGEWRAQQARESLHRGDCILAS